jgi:hypothetical protein
METFTPYNQIPIFEQQLYMSNMDCLYLKLTRPKYTVC